METLKIWSLWLTGMEGVASWEKVREGRKKLQEIENILINNNIDVLGISEANLENKIDEIVTDAIYFGVTIDYSFKCEKNGFLASPQSCLKSRKIELNAQRNKENT